jgi:predicted aspartyl protease
MIRGSVNPEGGAEVRLLIRGADAREEIRFVIDTGFNGFPTLPVDRIMALDLAFSHQAKATLANGETEAFDGLPGGGVWKTGGIPSSYCRRRETRWPG